MVLYNKQFNTVEFTGTIINSALLNKALYSKIDFKYKLIGGTYTIIDLIPVSIEYLASTSLVKFSSVMFGQLIDTALIPDGVYEITFTTTSLAGIISLEKLCLLVDNKLPCNIVGDDNLLKYLILKETYNCTCDCDKLDKIYKNILPNDTTNCNC
jgi:hypothetical protein